MPLVGGFGCLELVLYGIRELASQHYEPLILLQSEINVLWIFQGESDRATSPTEGDSGGRQQGGQVRPGSEAPHQEIHRGVPANTL